MNKKTFEKLLKAYVQNGYRIDKIKDEEFKTQDSLDQI